MTHRHTQERHLYKEDDWKCPHKAKESLFALLFLSLSEVSRVGCFPSQDSNHHPDSCIFRCGIPINLHFPLLPGGGSNNNLCIYIYIICKVKSPVHKPSVHVWCVFYSPACQEFTRDTARRISDLKVLSVAMNFAPWVEKVIVPLEGGCHEKP